MPCPALSHPRLPEYHRTRAPAQALFRFLVAPGAADPELRREAGETGSGEELAQLLWSDTRYSPASRPFPLVYAYWPAMLCVSVKPSVRIGMEGLLVVLRARRACPQMKASGRLYNRRRRRCISSNPELSYAVATSAISLIPHHIIRISCVVLTLAAGIVYYYLLITQRPATMLAELDALMDEANTAIAGAPRRTDNLHNIMKQKEHLLRVKQSASICRCLLLERKRFTWRRCFRLRRYLGELIADVRRIISWVQVCGEHHLQRSYTEDRLVAQSIASATHPTNSMAVDDGDPLQSPEPKAESPCPASPRVQFGESRHPSAEHAKSVVATDSDSSVALITDDKEKFEEKDEEKWEPLVTPPPILPADSGPTSRGSTTLPQQSAGLSLRSDVVPEASDWHRLPLLQFIVNGILHQATRPTLLEFRTAPDPAWTFRISVSGVDQELIVLDGDAMARREGPRQIRAVHREWIGRDRVVLLGFDERPSCSASCIAFKFDTASNDWDDATNAMFLSTLRRRFGESADSELLPEDPQVIWSDAQAAIKPKAVTSLAVPPAHIGSSDLITGGLGSDAEREANIVTCRTDEQSPRKPLISSKMHAMRADVVMHLAKIYPDSEGGIPQSLNVAEGAEDRDVPFHVPQLHDGLGGSMNPVAKRTLATYLVRAKYEREAKRMRMDGWERLDAPP
uniref:Uncharacterized protein n=1 Tax=Mycena chlorophos TaxID=658473 RepID=A0ABQ0LFZ2_MYCCL|nr:predicted protein [Mycena chlorophos]